MTIGSDGSKELIGLAPRGNQGKTQQILVKASGRLEIPGDVGGVMEPAWKSVLIAHCPLSI